METNRFVVRSFSIGSDEYSLNTEWTDKGVYISLAYTEGGEDPSGVLESSMFLPTEVARALREELTSLFSSLKI